MSISQIKEYSEVLIILGGMFVSIIVTINKVFKNAKNAIAELILDKLNPVVAIVNDISKIVETSKDNVLGLDGKIVGLETKIEDLKDSQTDMQRELDKVIMRLDTLTEIKKLA